ncbi:MAG: hemolysin family protein [Candidatus Polarisedimenticolia bacterium]
MTPLTAIALFLMGALYAVIAVFRSAYADLNTVTAKRILSARGLVPREGESAGDLPPVMRTTFDILHQVLLVSASALVFRWLVQTGATRPFVEGCLWIVIAVVMLQIFSRSVAASDPERAFSASLIVIALLYHAIRPVTAPVSWTLTRMRRVGRDRRAAAGEEEATEEEIEAFIDAGQQEGILEAEEGHLIRQVVEFHDSVVREVMTPRTEVVALPKSSTVVRAREVFAQERHSRLPVYRDHMDNVEGILTLKDLVASWGHLPEDGPIDSLVRPAFFVPETKQVSDLLKELQARRLHMAVVVDEYGGTAGVVTIEDLLEELVGEIREEHERDERAVMQEADGRYLVSGTAAVDELAGALGMEVDAEGVDTVSGLIYSALGRIPHEGEAVEIQGLRLEVVKADTRKIEQVRVTRLAETKAR